MDEMKKKGKDERAEKGRRKKKLKKKKSLNSGFDPDGSPDF
jgi:hypothetical protein